MNNFVKAVFFSTFLLSNAVFCSDADFQQLRSDHFIIQYHKDVDPAYSRKTKEKSEILYSDITQEFNLIRENLWIWGNRAKVFIAKDKDDYCNVF